MQHGQCFAVYAGHEIVQRGLRRRGEIEDKLIQGVGAGRKELKISRQTQAAKTGRKNRTQNTAVKKRL